MSKHTRFALYRGEWLAMTANVDEEDANRRTTEDPYEDEHVWVPNAVAAAAPDLLVALQWIAEQRVGFALANKEGLRERLRNIFSTANAAIAKAEEV